MRRSRNQRVESFVHRCQPRSERAGALLMCREPVKFVYAFNLLKSKFTSLHRT